MRVRKPARTPPVAGLLADAAGVARNAVTWAGLKDRHAGDRAVVRHPPAWQGQSRDLSVIQNDNIQILQVKRYNKKLQGRLPLAGKPLHPASHRTGSRPMEARPAGHRHPGRARNYYGEQRFRREGNNPEAARRCLLASGSTDRNKRPLYLPAARSMLFNAIVSARIEQGLAHQLLAGDCVMLKGSHPSSAKRA